MRHKHLFHFLLFRKFKETKSLYFLIALKTFALSLISIFVPIFLYKIGYSLNSIMLFFLIFSLCAFFSVFAGGFLFNKIGVKKSMLIGNLLLIVNYLLLAFIKVKPSFFYLAPIVFGAYQGIFWVNFHTDMADNLKRKKFADGIGALNIIASLVAAIAPFIGALIASVNFSTLFIISAVLIFVSIIPLFFSKGVREKGNFNIKEMFSLVNPKRFVAGIGVGGEYAIAYFVWPVFLFLLVGLKEIGWLTTILMVISAIFIILITKWIDKKGPNKVMKAGTLINTAHWPFRIIPGLAVVWYLGYSFLETFSKMPYTIKTYCVGKKGREINAIASREMTMMLGRIIAGVAIFMVPSFIFAFIIATVFSIMQFPFAFEKER